MEKLLEAVEEQKLKARWGNAFDEGFVVVPRVLLTRQAEIGLESGDALVLLNLLASWWADGKLPYPSVRLIATRMGTSTRTVQRSLERLESAGFLERLRMTHGTGRSAAAVVTRYDLSGTVRRLQGAALTPPRRVPAPRPSKFNAGRKVPAPNVEMKLEGFKEAT